MTSSWFFLSTLPHNSRWIVLERRKDDRSVTLTTKHTVLWINSMAPCPCGLIVVQLAKEFTTFYLTWNLITLFTVNPHFVSILGYINEIHTYLPVSWFVLLLSFHLYLDLSGGTLSSGFPTEILVNISCTPCTPHAQIILSSLRWLP